VLLFGLKVDCVLHHDLCSSQDIRAYPTLRMFVKGEPFQGGDYAGHRTVLDMVQFLRMVEEQLGKEGKLSTDSLSSALEKHLDMSVEERHWAEAFERTRKHHQEFEWNPNDHPGCQLSGSILLNRVPGNFCIEAFSRSHDLAPHMTNVSLKSTLCHSSQLIMTLESSLDPFLPIFTIQRHQ